MPAKLTLEKFIERSESVHGKKYDYSKSKYVNKDTKIEIVCPNHGSTWQIAHNHMRGAGCFQCDVDKRRVLFSKGKNNFIQQANEVHENKYDYSKVFYINNKTDVIIICSKHGEFLISPKMHIGIGNKLPGGCQKCSFEKRNYSNTKDGEQFVKDAKVIHGDLFDYSKVNYNHSKNKVEIICKKHGSFWQTPNSHLRGIGCAKCVGHISKMETEWLDFLKIPNDNNHRNVMIPGIGQLRVDGYFQGKAYEFHGSFWHGCPETFPDRKAINPISKLSFDFLYKRTLKKDQLIRSLGYDLIVMWEKDWIKFKLENEL